MCSLVLNCGFFIWPEGGPSNDLDDMLYGLLDINGETDWFCIKGRRETPLHTTPGKKLSENHHYNNTTCSPQIDNSTSFFVSPVLAFSKEGLNFQVNRPLINWEYTRPLYYYYYSGLHNNKVLWLYVVGNKHGLE